MNDTLLSDLMDALSMPPSGIERWKEDRRLGLTIDEREARDLKQYPDDEEAIREYYAGARERVAENERLAGEMAEHGGPGSTDDSATAEQWAFWREQHRRNLGLEPINAEVRQEVDRAIAERRAQCLG